MSRKERFTLKKKSKLVLTILRGNRSRSEICRELYISTSTMNIPVRRVLPHENIQMVGLTTTELSNKTSNNWLNGIAFYCQWGQTPFISKRKTGQIKYFYPICPYSSFFY